MAKCKYKSKLNLLYQCPDDALPDSDEGFCIFHERSMGKDIKKFNAGIKAKMEQKDYDFTGYYFPADIDFTAQKFEGWTRFDGAEFQGGARFRAAEFQDWAYFDGAKFHDTAWFYGAEFQGMIRFHGAEFHDRALFSEAQFQESALFFRAKFQNQASFNGAEFQGKADFCRAEFHLLALFKATEFQSQANFDEAKFQDQAWFEYAEFRRTVSFRDAHFRILSCAEPAYRKAKISWQREGDYAEAGYYRLLEMRARRKGRLEHLKEFIQFEFVEPRLAEKVVIVALTTLVRSSQKLERIFIDWTCGYGEQPWKVILTALTLVLGCAFLYYFFFPITSPDIQITGIGWGYFKDCLYFSFVTFTTLGYGDLRPMPEVGTRVIASIEAFTGAFMMALFVLCFARKWMR